jgi:hypothetical protein
MTPTFPTSGVESPDIPGRFINGEPGESVSHVADRLARAAERGADEAIVDFVFTYPTIDQRLDAAHQLIDLVT